MTPVHLAASSVASTIVAAVSFVVDGPTIMAIVTAATLMLGAVAKTWRASVTAAAKAQVLEARVTEQDRQISELKTLVNQQASIIATLAKEAQP